MSTEQKRIERLKKVLKDMELVERRLEEVNAKVLCTTTRLESMIRELEA